MKFFEICADVLVPESTRAEVRLPGFGFRASWDGVFESIINPLRDSDAVTKYSICKKKFLFVNEKQFELSIKG